MVAISDTTWDPTEYTNEGSKGVLAKRKSLVDQYVGKAAEPDRAPQWVIETSSKRTDYALPELSSIEIVIFDVSGRQLSSGIQDSGYYSVVWDGCDEKGRKASVGIYFVEFVADSHKKVEKTILLR